MSRWQSAGGPARKLLWSTWIAYGSLAISWLAASFFMSFADRSEIPGLLILASSLIGWFVASNRLMEKPRRLRFLLPWILHVLMLLVAVLLLTIRHWMAR